MSKCTASEAVAKAKYYIGYYEKASNYNLDSFTGNAGSANWTRFGRDAGMNPAAWCAMFCSCVLKECSSASDAKTMCWGQWPHYNCGTIADTAKAQGKFHWSSYRGGSYTPQAGDWIVFTYNGSSRDHVGMVNYVSNGYVYTIEGNKSDKVKECSYALSNSTIYGYCTPNYADDVVVDTPIKKYQKWLNVTVDGEYGPATKKAAIYWHQKAMEFRDKYADGEWGWNTYGWGWNYPCEYGDKGWDAYIVQGQLYCLGYDPQGFDGEIGKNTCTAIKKLQQDKGLTVTGTVDMDTWAALFGEKKPAHTVLKSGSIGGEVFYAQKKLFGLGYNIACDGAFGEGTVDDVKDFQNKNGIEVDGIIGNGTWAKLDV